MKLFRFAPRFTAMAALALALIFSGCAGVDYLTTVPRYRPAAGKGLVIFYREDRFLGSEVAYKVRDAFAPIGGLPNGTYFAYQADPGRHFFNASTELTNQVIVDVAAGHTYFVRGAVRPGVVIWRPTLESVSRAEGAAALDGLRAVAMRPAKPKKMK